MNPRKDAFDMAGMDVVDPGQAQNTSEEHDAPLPTTVTGASDPKFFTEEDLQKARGQEKSKLYKRLESMQETVARLEKESRDRSESAEAEQRAVQDAERAHRESEMSAKDLLAQKEKEWGEQLRQVQTQVEQERALREQETRYAEIMEVRQGILSQYSDRVAPELLDLIEGDTPEEIRQSAEDMSQRTARILAQTAEAVQNARQAMPTVRATSPASGENSGAQRTLTPEEIRGMSMKDFAKHRRSLLGGGADGPSNRGLFG